MNDTRLQELANALEDTETTSAPTGTDQQNESAPVDTLPVKVAKHVPRLGKRPRKGFHMNLPYRDRDEDQ
jgi:hypothetical protein